MTSASTSIAELYNWRYARGYTTNDYRSFAHADLRVLSSLLDMSAFRGGDVGCGTGEHLVAMKDAGIQWPVGIDISAEALRYVMTRDTGKDFILIKADVIRWRCGGFFDLVVCSLPPIGDDPDRDALLLFGALNRILKSGGFLHLKVFCFDHAAEMIGDFSVNYEGSTAAKKSRVRLDEHARMLVIEEHYADAPEDCRIEKLRLVTRREIINDLARAELHVDEELSNAAALHPEAKRLPGTITLLARKP